MTKALSPAMLAAIHGAHPDGTISGASAATEQALIRRGLAEPIYGDTTRAQPYGPHAQTVYNVYLGARLIPAFPALTPEQVTQYAFFVIEEALDVVNSSLTFDQVTAHHASSGSDLLALAYALDEQLDAYGLFTAAMERQYFYGLEGQVATRAAMAKLILGI